MVINYLSPLGVDCYFVNVHSFFGVYLFLGHVCLQRLGIFVTCTILKLSCSHCHCHLCYMVSSIWGKKKLFSGGLLCSSGTGLLFHLAISDWWGISLYVLDRDVLISWVLWISRAYQRWLCVRYDLPLWNFSFGSLGQWNQAMKANKSYG